MKKSMLLAGVAMLLSAATPALAQSTISPGMTTEQVRDRFGAPATTRAQGEWSYWYYHNGCPVRCGSDDVVFFQNERVVAAVLRTSRRRFAGPAADDALNAAGGVREIGNGRTNDAPAEGESRARVGGVRVEGGPPASNLVTTPDRAPVNQPREGRPGEPSTIVITQPEAAPAERVTPPVPVNQAREGQAGEPSTIIITTPPADVNATQPATDPAQAAGTNPPEVDGRLPATPVPAAAPGVRPADPAENTEAADTRGETSIDRKSRRTRQDRANEATATERARRNDAKNP
ncbi:MAG TPA: hypothetical protein VEQ60_14790 [Longimicrobium sp.]|nr:hypothetical protein [Longimicrobium sp.]